MEEAADAAHSTQVERAALLCLRRSRYVGTARVGQIYRPIFFMQPSVRCVSGVCMPEAVGVRSLRAARERLPSARELAESSPREL